MGADSGQAGYSGRPAEGGDDPRTAQRQDPLSKGQEGVSGQPTVSSMPGAGPGAAGGTPAPGSPVGPPPPAPGGPQASPAYGSGYGPQGPPPGYAGHGGYGHAGYGGHGGHGGYGAQGGYGYGGPAQAGYAPPGYGWGGPPLPQGTAIASMVLGIVGLILTSSCWGAFLGVFVAPLALILGVSARRKADRGEGGGRSYATGGFVMGIIGTVLSVIVIAVLIVGIVMAERSENGRDGTSGGDYYDALRVPAAASATGR